MAKGEYPSPQEGGACIHLPVKSPVPDPDGHDWEKEAFTPKVIVN